MNKFQEVKNIILRADRISIFPHINMDADTLGSSVALSEALRKLGKETKIIISENISKRLDFLKNDNIADFADQRNEHFDVGIMVDCSGLKRIEPRNEIYKKCDIKVAIDHHIMAENDIDFDCKIIESDSAATGELIYLLIKELGINMDLEIANAIFAAITTDTGNFQFDNTTKRTHLIASELFDVDGFSSKKVSNMLYQRVPFSQMKLENYIISNLQFLQTGKVAIGCITKEALKKCDADMEDGEGIVQKIIKLAGIEVAVLIKEDDDKIRVSLRSKNNFDVSEIASENGGGGHRLAAGFSSNKSIDDTTQALIEYFQGVKF